MKKRFLAISGVLLLVAMRIANRARSLGEDIGERMESFEPVKVRGQVKRLSKRAGKFDTGKLKDQVAALAAAAETSNDRQLRRQVKRMQKSVDSLDTGKIRKQADKVADSLKARQKQRRRFPVIPALLVAGAIGAGFFASRRREQLLQQFGGQDGAQRRLPGVLEGLRSRGGGQAQEQELKAAVESALHSTSPAIAPDIRVEVEGRTVYLRGATTDREQLESGIRRAQEIPGVAAVINLVSMTSPSQAATAGTNAGQPASS